MAADIDLRGVSKLNISIAVFDPGVPENRSLHRDLDVFPRVRKIEALFLPFVLRETLVATEEWGAVRVIPEPDDAAELLVSGAVVRSDGEHLDLQLRVVDASGRVWLDQVYNGIARKSELTPNTSAYQALYDTIANDLLLARAQLEGKALRNVVNISMLRYANSLAPSAFSDYFSKESDGTFRIVRLPAENDPMLARIDRIRNVEYVITDAVDAKFQELHAEVESTYRLWGEYRRKFAEYQLEEARRVQNFTSNAPRGSFESMQERYENYKWDRLAVQEQEKWAVGFNNEVAPTVAEMESRVAELEGWVDRQYSEWSRILGEMFELETSM